MKYLHSFEDNKNYIPIGEEFKIDLPGTIEENQKFLSLSEVGDTLQTENGNVRITRIENDDIYVIKIYTLLK